MDKLALIAIASLSFAGVAHAGGRITNRNPQVVALKAQLTAQAKIEKTQARLYAKVAKEWQKQDALSNDRFLVTENYTKTVVKAGNAIRIVAHGAYAYPPKGAYVTKEQADKMLKQSAGYPYSIYPAKGIVGWISANQGELIRYGKATNLQFHGSNEGPL